MKTRYTNDRGANLMTSQSATRPAKSLPSFALELLEDRCVPATLTVNSLADDGGAVGELTLREAIEAVNAGNTTPLDGDGDEAQVTGVFGIDDTIVFSTGTGTIQIGDSGASAQLSINNDVVIDASDITGGITIDAEEDNRIFNLSNANVTLNNLTLTNGRSNDGGGALVNGGSLTVIDSTFSDNTSTNQGGGIHIDSSTLTISNSIFTGNEASDDGGAIYSDGSTDFTISNTLFEDNHSLNNDAGGISLENGSPGVMVLIENSIFTGNTGSSAGGAIYNSDEEATVIIRNSLFTDNYSDGDGGAIYFDDGVGYIINCTITGNEATADGGGVYSGGEVHIINSTITGNTAGGDGGGFYSDGSYDNFIDNSIISGNSAGVNGDDLYDETTDQTTGSNNLFTTGGVDRNSNFDGNSLFVADVATVLNTTLADNGGPTMTHALLDGSVAIDAGDNALAVDEDDNPLEIDQRGVTRVLNGGTSNTVDIGAYEYAVGQIITSPADGSNVSDSFTVTLDNVFDLNDDTDINTIFNSLLATNGTISDFVDNGDGTASFTVTPVAVGDVTITAYDDSITVSNSGVVTDGFTATDYTGAALGESTPAALAVTATPNDGTLTQDDITVTNGVVTQFVDNGDGSFSFTIAPNDPGTTVTVTADGVDGTLTTEFAALTFGNTNGAFVTNLYQVIFDRDPSVDEVSFWTSEMTAGTTQREVIASFLASTEFTAGLSNPEIVDAIYQLLFTRDAETDFWDNQLNAGASTYDVALEILGSLEASQRFVQETYNEQLRRLGEEEGVNYWAAALAAQEITLEQLDDEFANTSETPAT